MFVCICIVVSDHIEGASTSQGHLDLTRSHRAHFCDADVVMLHTHKYLTSLQPDVRKCSKISVASVLLLL